MSCSTSLSWPSRSRCRVSAGTHRPARRQHDSTAPAAAAAPGRARATWTAAAARTSLSGSGPRAATGARSPARRPTRRTGAPGAPRAPARRTWRPPARRGARAARAPAAAGAAARRRLSSAASRRRRGACPATPPPPAATWVLCSCVHQCGDAVVWPQTVPPWHQQSWATGEYWQPELERGRERGASGQGRTHTAVAGVLVPEKQKRRKALGSKHAGLRTRRKGACPELKASFGQTKGTPRTKAAANVRLWQNEVVGIHRALGDKHAGKQQQVRDAPLRRRA